MQSVDLTLSLPESMQLPVPEYITRDTVVREELLSWNVRERDAVICFLACVVGDREACRAAAADLDAVNRCDFTRVDDDTFYVYAEMDLRRVDRTLIEILDSQSVVLVPPVVYTNTATLHITVLGEQEALSRVVDGIPDAVSVEIDRVGEHRHRTGSLAGRLTARQFEAIGVARELGYYAVPREAALSEVATALDCSESAASTLLRNGEQALVNAALGR